MATDHDVQQTMRSSDAVCLISKRPSRLLDDDRKGAWAGCSLSRAPWEVGEAEERGANGVKMHYPIIAQSIVRYNTL